MLDQLPDEEPGSTPNLPPPPQPAEPARPDHPSARLSTPSPWRRATFPPEREQPAPDGPGTDDTSLLPPAGGYGNTATASGANLDWIDTRQHAPDEDTDAEDTENPDEDAPAVRPHRSRKRRALRIIALVAGLSVLIAGVGAAAGGWLYYRSVSGAVDRVEAFAGVPEAERPPRVAEQAMNILILGSDSRDPDATAGSRTDTIILAHIPANRQRAQLISIPRDTWVRIPKTASGKGGQDAKINAAFALGGVPLMVQTVESFTKVRIDHVALVDFAGFTEIVDALGGVTITVDKKFTSIHPPFRTFNPGPQRLGGAEALDYSRQRKQFADGDFTRIQHQQQLIKAVLAEAVSRGLLTDPGRLDGFLRATADAVTVDTGFSIIQMANNLRHLRGENLDFLTSPSRGTGMVGDQSVVFADAAKAAVLYEAVRGDRVEDWQAGPGAGG